MKSTKDHISEKSLNGYPAPVMIESQIMDELRNSEARAIQLQFNKLSFDFRRPGANTYLLRHNPVTPGVASPKRIDSLS